MEISGRPFGINGPLFPAPNHPSPTSGQLELPKKRAPYPPLGARNRASATGGWPVAIPLWALGGGRWPFIGNILENPSLIGDEFGVYFPGATPSPTSGRLKCARNEAPLLILTRGMRTAQIGAVGRNVPGPRRNRGEGWPTVGAFASRHRDG